MGLDVYLYKYSAKDAIEKLEAEYDRRRNALWTEICGEAPYEEVPEERKLVYRAANAELQREMGLDSDGEVEKPRKEKIELDSVIDPEHMFKIGYMRSSYNEGGVNSLMAQQLGITLYDLFPESNGQEYIFQPDWVRSKQLVINAYTTWQEQIDRDGSYSVIELQHNPFLQPYQLEAQGAKGALEVFLKEKKREGSFSEYSTINGTFYMGDNPVPLRAIVHGRDERGQRTFYAVSELTNGMKYYIDALRIVEETIDYVLSQPDPEKYWLLWSG